MKNIAAIVLASGLSRRFGSSKLQADFHGQPLGTIIQKLLAKLPDNTAAQITETILVTTGRESPVIAGPGSRIIINQQPELGQSHSLVLGLQSANEADGALFLNADQPFLTEQVISRILNEFAVTDKIIVPRANGLPQSPCLFPKRFFPLLLKIRGDKGGREIYQAIPEETVFLDFDNNNLFFDIDTPEDYLTAVKML